MSMRKTHDSGLEEGNSRRQGLTDEKSYLLDELLRYVPADLALVDRTGRVTYATRRWNWLTAAENLMLQYGYSIADAPMIQTSGVFGTNRAAQRALDGLRSVLSGSLPTFQMEYIWKSARGPHCFLLQISAMPPAHGGALMSRTDVTARKQAQAEIRARERELRKTTAELRELARHLIETQEEERRRIARELHDDVGQKLTALSLRVAAMRDSARDEGATLDVDLNAAAAEIGGLMSTVHALSHGMHPAGLGNAAVVPALQRLCSDIEKMHDIRIMFSSKPHAVALPSAVRLALFRIAQEALQNVVVHSGSTRAHVRLEKRAVAVVLTVRDWGKGFDVQAPLLQHGLGLLSMRERARLIGATLRVRSRPAAGTLVRVALQGTTNGKHWSAGIAR